MRYFTDDFLFIINKSSLPALKVNLNFPDFNSFHAAVKANGKPTSLLLHFSVLHSVMSVAVLWRTCLLPLKNRQQNSCCLRGKYRCQFDPRECLKLTFSCCWLGA